MSQYNNNPIYPTAIQTLWRLLLVAALASVLSGCLESATQNQRVTPVVAAVDGDSSSDSTAEELPDNTPVDPNSTVQTIGLTKLTSFSEHACAIRRSDNSSWCWGNNNSGRLGTGGTTHAWSPVQTGGIVKEWLMISAGRTHTCGIRKGDSALSCWGNNQLDQISGKSLLKQINLPYILDVNPWLTVSTGNDHSCGIKTTGELYCWGNNQQGQTGQDPATAIISSVTQLGTDADWIDVQAGDGFSCGLKNDNTLWCWGADDHGQLGRDPTIVSPSPALYVPVAVNADNNWSQVSTGYQHVCAIKTDQTLWCWGENQDVQLGINQYPNPATPPTYKFVPQQIGTDTWLRVASGGAHSCGIKTDYTLWCWGNNYFGQLGTGDTANKAQPYQIDTKENFIDVVAGNQHTCAETDTHLVYCWGSNSIGQLGIGEVSLSTYPRNVNSSIWNKVSSGAKHTCAISDDLRLWCGGDNSYGQLGDGTPLNRSTAVAVDISTTTTQSWSEVSAGANHTCAIKSDDQSIYCWGDNANGQLGRVTTSALEQWKPELTDNTRQWLKVSGGGHHTCAIAENTTTLEYTLYCWGDNSSGQLGNASAPAAATDIVQEANGNTDWSIVSSGTSHSCAIRYIGTPVPTSPLYCWGNNSDGQLGIGSTANADIPTLVGNLTDHWIDVAAGDRHTCAIKEDPTSLERSLYCWGADDVSQIADGTSTVSPSTLPVDIGQGNTDWNHIYSGANFSCASRISSKYRSYCWGQNNVGQLGGQNSLLVLSPTLLSFSSDVEQTLALGSQFACAIVNNIPGNLQCWGEGGSAQLGDGSYWKDTPQQVPLQ